MANENEEKFNQAKTRRKTAKCALTKQQNRVTRLVQESKPLEEVKAERKILFKTFEEFSTAHGEFCSVSGAVEEKALDQQEKYFMDTEVEYIGVISKINEWVDKEERKEHRAKEEEEKSKFRFSAKPGGFYSSSYEPEDPFKDLLVSVNLPKLELSVYDGDPLQYHAFITAFDESVDKMASSSVAKLTRLAAYTTGAAHQAIKSTLMMSGQGGYAKAREILHRRFGDEQVICQAVMKSLKTGVPVKGAEQLHALADELVNSQLILERLGTRPEAESQTFIASVIDRLQPYLKGKWRKRAMDFKRDRNIYPNFGHLVEFVQNEAAIASDPVYGETGLLSFRKYGDGGVGKANPKSNFNVYHEEDGNGYGYGDGYPETQQETLATRRDGNGAASNGGAYKGAYNGGSNSGGANNNGAYRKRLPCHFCKDSSHAIFMCNDFRALKAAQKLEYVRQNNLCENCYYGNHSVSDCRFPSKCGIDGCSVKHSRLLHEALSGKNSGLPQSSKPRASTDSLITTVLTCSSNTCIPIVKVRVNNSVDCTAMLDTCSTATFISRQLADELGVHSRPISYDLSTLTGDNVHQESGLISTLFVEGYDQGQSVQLSNVHIIDRIPGSGSTLDCSKYGHLQGLDVITSSPSVGLLIGQDNAECLVPLDCRRGQPNQPFAVKTILGWSVHGSDGQKDFCGLLVSGLTSHKVISNFIKSNQAPLEVEDKQIQSNQMPLKVKANQIKPNQVPPRGEVNNNQIQINNNNQMPLKVEVNNNNNNSINQINNQTANSNQNNSKQTKQQGSYEELKQSVDRLWELEHEGFATEECVWSKTDEQVIEYWNDNIQFKEGHYELPIPWKADVHVPNNYTQAQARLTSTYRSVNKKGILVKYNTEFDKLFDKGFAESVPAFQGSDERKVWYLPHHPVINDKKPDKLRVVFDCSARYGGESLNDKCYQGPNLNNNLTHVLLRFRQHPVGIMADIESMFYQVWVSNQDRDALRFIWYDCKTGEEVVSRMKVHIFGGVWCPCIATYALRRTIVDQEVEDQFVKKVISKSFYVDDLLQSVSDVEEAEKVINQVRLVLGKGGFNLTKFISNNPQIMETVPEESQAKEIKNKSLEEKSNQINSKVLGINWNVTKDEFQVSTEVKINSGVLTRRKMLSTIASMYDPLGLVSPTAVVGKIIFQEATRIKLDWDEEVPVQLQEEWNKWLKSIQDLNKISFPRCLTNPVPEAEETTYQVHNFSDASEKGYGCCSYLRTTQALKDGSKKVDVRLIASKSRVSPINKVSIPRLELQAALLAAQLNNTIIKELELPIKESFFWTDSQITLAYIQNEDRRWKTYVANRVAKIKSITTREQWRFIPGKENPADLASRGASAEDLQQSTWMSGPKWLESEQQNTSPVSAVEVPEEDLEIKKEISKITTNLSKKSNQENQIKSNQENQAEHPINQLINHFSEWYKIKKAVAWLLKVKTSLQNKKKLEKKMSVEDLEQAEITIIKHIQEENFPEEIRRLKKGEAVQKRSHIRELNPTINQQGILCVGGRLRFLKDKEQVKHPWILPKTYLSRIIVREYHQKAHQGTEWTLALLREKYWIVRARSIIKSVSRECVICKKLYGKPRNQKMSDLPEERLRRVQPFNHVGIDCFGPFYIQQGRHQVKRYGCVFTCMNYRAVHIEKLNTLETDSFINAFRRFMARRGKPSKVWSDNGTNFVGASPELLKELQSLDQQKISEYGLRRNIQWQFNTPHASHMGGVWERQIRTIRKILTSLLHQHMDRISDEVIETLFCEVESMINSRPLTKVSDDVMDATTISPNQILMINEPTSYSRYYQEFHKGDLYKRRWRMIQHIANQFWKRWVKEYVPELQKRVKWNHPEENLKVGDVVLICEETTPRFLWPLGLVVEVKVGRDGLVRTVKVKTKSTILTRPVSKIVKLEGSLP